MLLDGDPSWAPLVRHGSHASHSESDDGRRTWGDAAILHRLYGGNERSMRECVVLTRILLHADLVGAFRDPGFLPLVPLQCFPP